MIFVPLVSLLTCAVALFPQLPLRDPEAPRPGEPGIDHAYIDDLPELEQGLEYAVLASARPLYEVKWNSVYTAEIFEDTLLVSGIRDGKAITYSSWPIEKVGYLGYMTSAEPVRLLRGVPDLQMVLEWIAGAKLEWTDALARMLARSIFEQTSFFGTMYDFDEIVDSDDSGKTVVRCVEKPIISLPFINGWTSAKVDVVFQDGKLSEISFSVSDWNSESETEVEDSEVVNDFETPIGFN